MSYDDWKTTPPDLDADDDRPLERDEYEDEPPDREWDPPVSAEEFAQQQQDVIEALK